MISRVSNCCKSFRRRNDLTSLPPLPYTQTKLPPRRETTLKAPSNAMGHNRATLEHSELEGNPRQAIQNLQRSPTELGRSAEETALGGGAAGWELGDDSRIAPIASTCAMLGCGNLRVVHAGHPNVKKAEKQSLCGSTVHRRDIPRYLSVSLSMLARVDDAEVQDVVAHIMKEVIDLGAQTGLSWKSEPGGLGGVEIAVQLALVEQTQNIDNQVWEVSVCLRVQEEADISCAASQSRGPRKKSVADQRTRALPQLGVVQHQPARNSNQVSVLAKRKHETTPHSIELSAHSQRPVELFF